MKKKIQNKNYLKKGRQNIGSTKVEIWKDFLIKSNKWSPKIRTPKKKQKKDGRRVWTNSK